MNFSLTHLRYFRDAAIFQSVAKAAKKNLVSPPAISQAIKSLENSFGVPLMEHRKRRFELTDAGEELLAKGQRLIQEAFNLHESISDHAKSNSGDVVIATQQSLANHVLPRFMSHMTRKFPNIRIHWIFGVSIDIKEQLRTRQANIAVSTDNVSFHAFEHIEVLSGDYILVKSKNFKQKVHRFILTSETPETSHFCKSYRATFRKEPEIIMQVDSWGVIKKLCEEGVGIGLVPDYLTRFETKPIKVELLNLGIKPSPYKVGAYFTDPIIQQRKSCQIVLDELRTFFR